MKSVWTRWLAASVAGKLAVLCTSAVLLACGGGGEAGTPLLGGGTGSGGGSTASPTAADVVLVMSAPNVANNGTESVVATATAIDANRNALSGIPIAISVNANAIATPTATKTNASGVLTANIGIGADRSVRTITVTAVSGAVTRSATLDVRDAGGATTVAADMILALSSAQIANTGAQTITATATALDAKRNVLKGADLSLSVDANAVLVPSGSTTNDAGVVTGTVSIGTDRSNRSITVTARSGTTVRTAVLLVTDLPGVGPPVAADLSLVLSAPKLTNGGSNTITATATAVDANRNALAGIPITIRVDASAVATVSGTTTNTQGQVVAGVGMGADRSNRVVTVTAASGSLTRSSSFTVEGAELRATFSPRVTAGSVGNLIEYTLVDTNALPMVGQRISVTAPGLPASAGVTDQNGKYGYSYTAPATHVTVTATAAGASRSVTVEIGSGAIDPATNVPQSASVSPSPSVVSVNNAGSSAICSRALAMAYAGAVNAEVLDLFAAGADFVQVDEPYMHVHPTEARSYGIAALQHVRNQLLQMRSFCSERVTARLGNTHRFFMQLGRIETNRARHRLPVGEA